MLVVLMLTILLHVVGIIIMHIYACSHHIVSYLFRKKVCMRKRYCGVPVGDSNCDEGVSDNGKSIFFVILITMCSFWSF